MFPLVKNIHAEKQIVSKTGYQSSLPLKNAKILYAKTTAYITIVYNLDSNLQSNDAQWNKQHSNYSNINDKRYSKINPLGIMPPPQNSALIALKYQ